MVDLPEPESPVNHSTQGSWPLRLGAGLRVHVERLPMDVGRAPETELDHAGADRRIGEAVDDDETAGVAIFAIGIEGEGFGCREIAIADLVELERARRDVLERVDVDLVLERRDLTRRRTGLPPLIRYWRCGSISSSAIQRICAANWSATSGRSSGATSMSPREMSTSSARTMVTAWPATATSRSPSAVTMRVTCDVRPERATTTGSPGFTMPLTIVPAKPRKSRFGRFTHCTGMRNGLDTSSLSTSTVSRWSSSVGPSYQGVRSLAAMTLSP